MGVQNKKNIFFGIIFGLVLFIFLAGGFLAASQVYAITVDTSIGTELDLGTADLQDTVVNIIQWALGLLGLVGVVMIIYGGFIWMTAAGNEDKIAKAKKIITQAVIGLVIVLLSWAIVMFIVDTMNEVTSPYPAHCSNGVFEPLLLETATDCGGPCPACFTGGTLPTDTFTWVETQTSFALGGDYATDVNRCSRVQPAFNHRIDQSSFVTAFTNGHIKLEYDNAGTWDEFIPLIGAIDIATSRNGITIKHDDDLLDANTSFRLWIPKYVLDRSSNILDTCLITTGICNEDSNPFILPLVANNSFVWYFDVGNEVDLVDPEITITYPVSPPDPNHPYRNVSMSPNIEVKFNEAIDITSIDDGTGSPIATNFVLERIDGAAGSVVTTCQGGINGGDICTANADCDSNVCSSPISNTNFEVTLSSNGFNINPIGGYIFDAFAWYRISVSGIEDLCANTMVGTYSWEFQTNDMQPGISARYPTGTAACPSATPIILVTFNTTMYYNDVTIVLTDGVNTASAIINAWGMSVPPGVYQTSGSNSNIEILDTNNINEFRAYRLLPTFPLVVGTTYDVTILTDKVKDISGSLVEDTTWQFTVAAADQCRCEPVISHISPEDGFEEQCVTVNGMCFDGEGNADGLSGVGIAPVLRFVDHGDNNPNVGANIGGYYYGPGPNYITTTIPAAFRYLPTPGNVSPAPQIDITYNDSDLGIASSTNSSVWYTITQDQVSTGPCLWKLNPDAGYIDDPIGLDGDRFNPATPPPGGTKHIGFQEGSNNYTQSYSSIWNNNRIDSLVQTDPPPSLMEGINYNVTVNNDSGQSNAIEYSVKVVPPGQSRVTSPYPTCTAACVNVLAQATITNNPIVTDVVFDDLFVPNPTVRMLCISGICNGLYIDISSSTSNVNGTELDLTINHPNLDPSETYRVIITNGIQNSDGGTIYNVNYDNDGDSIDDSFSWTFTTKNDPLPCVIDTVDVEPVTHTMAWTETKQFEGSGRGQADACDPNGQLLPVLTNWNWTSSNTGAATIANIAPLDNNPNNQTATGVATGVTTIRGTVDGIWDESTLTITDCNTDSDCELGCSAFPGNGSVCDVPTGSCTPWVGDITPPSGPAGTTVSIEGCYFGNTRGALDFALLPVIYNCSDPWTNNLIIATTNSGLPPNASHAVNVTTTGGFTNFSSPATNSNQAIVYPIVDFCASLCDATSDNAGAFCSNDLDCINSALIPGACSTGAFPPATGLPGLCDIVPPAEEIGELVDFNGFNLTSNVYPNTIARFSNDTGGFIPSTSTTGGGNAAGDQYTSAEIPVGSNTGPANIAVDNSGSYCASNEIPFGISCNVASDCSSGCCGTDKLCHPLAVCSTGGPGSLCQLPANYNPPNTASPTCEYGQTVSSGGIYSCIDFEGHSDPYVSPNDPGYPPAPGGVNPGTDCRTCCAPGQTNGLLDCNVDTVSACTGTDRGLYCGCDYANTTVGDSECDDGTGTIACGTNTCCYNRPDVVPNIYSSDCRNVVLTMTFDQEMDQNSFVLGSFAAGDSVEVWDGVVVVSGTLKTNATGFSFYPDQPFDESATNTIITISVEESLIKSKKGVAMGLPAVVTSQSYTINANAEICQIEDINFEWYDVVAVSYNPSPSLITCAHDNCEDDYYVQDVTEIESNAFQQYWTAWPVNKYGDQMSGGIEITWNDNNANDIFDVSHEGVATGSPLYNTPCASPQVDSFTCLITSLNKNGRGEFSVTADGSINSLLIDGATVDLGTVTRRAEVNAMICNNPWPDAFAGDELPFRDTLPPYDKLDTITGTNHFTTNFSTWYCRDNGLPILDSVANTVVHEGSSTCLNTSGTCFDNTDCTGGTDVCWTGNDKDELLKEYFFLRSGSDDGIGIRVYENEDGKSAREWYFNQFGSAAPDPQDMQVDGYNAIRAGRTVYVSAWNIPGATTLYPQIYLISYNEGASEDTIRIYNELINNWQFNINVSEVDQAMMQRDMKRVNDLNDIYIGALRYKTTNGSFPKLEGGTYIFNLTSSGWPSWQSELGSTIGISMPIDPFNSFISCPFDSKDTCWDEVNQQYVCPVDSYTYQYIVNPDGDNAFLYANLEYLSFTAPSTWTIGAGGNFDPCTASGFTNAICNCFNYTRSVTGTSLDHDGPIFVSVVPAGFVNVNGVVDIVVDWTDISGVNMVEFYIDGQYKYTDTDSAIWSWVFNSNEYADNPLPLHPYTLLIRAYDNMGNWSDYTAAVTVNNSGAVNNHPFVDITTPADGATIAGDVPVEVFSSDDGSVTNVTLEYFDSDGALSICSPASFGGGVVVNNWDTVDCDVTPGPDTHNGVYTIVATATDDTSLVSTKTITVKVENFDVTSPVVTIGDIAGTCSAANWSCSDSTTGPICNRYDTCTDGTTCPADDLATATACDQSNPTCILAAAPKGDICQRGNDPVTNDPIIVNITVDDLNYINVVQVYIDDMYRGDASHVAANNWIWEWNTFEYINAEHKFTIFAYDEFNNIGSDTVMIQVDNELNDQIPPTIEFTSPTPDYGTAVDNIIVIAALANDNRGVNHVNFYVDYRRQSIDSLSPWEYQINTNILTDGWHSIQIESVDSAGNRSIAKEILVNVRGNGGPIITLSSVTPNSGAIGDNFCLQATVIDDDGIASVYAYLQNPDGTDIIDPFNPVNMTLTGADIYEGSWTASVSVATAFFVDIEARDTAGNTSRANNITGVIGTCGAIPPSCNNDTFCDTVAGETAANCPADCTVTTCPNGTCDAAGGETNLNCPADCDISVSCGDGTCNTWESTISCSTDCTSPCFCSYIGPTCATFLNQSACPTSGCDWSTFYGCISDNYCDAYSGPSSSACEARTVCSCGGTP